MAKKLKNYDPAEDLTTKEAVAILSGWKPLETNDENLYPLSLDALR